METGKRSKLSIGAKLALRYALATSFTITVLGGFVYAQIEGRINRQATLVLEVHVTDLVDAVNTQSSEHPREHVLTWLAQQIELQLSQSPPDLGLGIELLDEKGRELVEGGSLAGPGPPFAASLQGEDERPLRAVDLGGDHAHLLMTAPVAGGFVRMAIETTRFAENVAQVRRVFLLALPIVLGATAALGWLLARASLRPIHEINRTARRIGGANLEETIPTTGSGDELDQLASTLNEMIARIRSSMERERRFTGNAAHQLLTPLTAIRNQIDVTLERAREASGYRDVLEDVLAETNRMTRDVDAMLQLARSEGGLAEDRRRAQVLAPILHTAVEFFEPLAEDRGVTLHVGESANATVSGDASWLSQLFSNLLSNAINYTPAGGRVAVGSSLRGGSVEVRIRDDGPGIDSAMLGVVFERFQRALTGSARGFGLGLPIAREIARAHGGDVTIEDTSAEGTTFLVTLPLEKRSHGH